MPVYCEEAACLDLTELARMGLFRGARLVLVTRLSVAFKVRYSEFMDAVYVEPPWSPSSNSWGYVGIRHVEVGRHRAKKRLLVCPESQDLCTKLYIKAGRLGCAKALGLVNASRNLYGDRHKLEVFTPLQERKRAGPAERQERVRPSGGGFQDGFCGGSRPVSARQQATEGPLSTLPALAEARIRGLVRDAYVEERFSQIERGLHGDLARVEWSRPTSRKLVTDVPSLDSRALAQVGFFDDRRDQVLTWALEGEEGVTAWARAVLEPEPMMILFCPSLRKRFWKIELVGWPAQKPGRWRFRCPLSGQPLDSLHLRDGVFGSRQSLSLTYPSQLISKGARARSRAKRALSEEEARTAAAAELRGQRARRGAKLRKLRRALKESGWNLSAAAGELRMTRTELQAEIEASPILQEDAEDHHEYLLDLVEKFLFDRIETDNNTAAARKYLELFGRDRGYGPQPRERRPIKLDDSRLLTEEEWEVTKPDKDMDEWQAKIMHMLGSPSELRWRSNNDDPWKRF